MSTDGKWKLQSLEPVPYAEDDETDEDRVGSAKSAYFSFV